MMMEYLGALLQRPYPLARIVIISKLISKGVIGGNKIKINNARLGKLIKAINAKGR